MMQDLNDITEYNLDDNEEVILSEGSEEENSPISEYGICIKCKKRSHYQWCQQCERKQCKENFTKWTSGNEEIDHFLQNSQLNSINPQTFLEWIPYDRLQNIKYLDKASRSTLYSAIWTDGPKILWNQKNQEYKRSKIKVLVKMYHKDQINEILKEVLLIILFITVILEL